MKARQIMAQMQIEIWRDWCVVAAAQGLIEAAHSFGAFVLRRAYGRTPGGF